jgi:hypothetical protein
MSEEHDIFFRAHTVVIDKPKKKYSRRKGGPKWPQYALVFDCKSRIDTGQKLTFGFFRILKLNGKTYQLDEEGAFFDDDLPEHEREVLESYTDTTDTEVRSFPPRFPLYPRSKFVQYVFYKMARKGALIVGFNLNFGIARLARQWNEGTKHEWSMVLVENEDGSENPLFPPVLINPIDSKKSFMQFRLEWVPKNTKVVATKINNSRFLDLQTILWALFNTTYSLKMAYDNRRGPFKDDDLPQKVDHKPTGKVTLEEIRYAHQDVKCSAALLNSVKRKFDLHKDLDLGPDKAYSAASMAKAYLDAMKIKPPSQKFDIPNEILGIAMESYAGGRAETYVRHEEVPVVPLDFTSEYSTTCVLLGLWDLLTAESLSIDDATLDVQRLLNRITLAACFERELWPDFRFFALIQPSDDVIVPVRTSYNGVTRNIGNNYLASDKSVWVAGPDLLASVIRTSKIPQIERAIRVVPHGKQAGMKPVNLRGMVRIDPNTDDLFKRVIEQRMLNKSNKELYYWLKIFANAIYGFFVEINTEVMPERNPVRVHVYSGEDSFEPEERFEVAENHGRWYAPYLAALITSAGRLLLAMLEECVAEIGGTYLYADTDALAVVSSEHGGSLRHLPGCQYVRALSWVEVQSIVDRFESLNPYDREAVPGSILNLTDDNYKDSNLNNPRRPLLGFSISTKRYTLYERTGSQITIINPKAHGLGYLYPPIDSPKDWDDEHDAPKWIYDFWECLLRIGLKLERNDPSWLERPQMMRMAVTTHNVLNRLDGLEGFRPYNFFLLPILAHSGYPANVDPSHFTLVTNFEADQGKWMDSVCINIGDCEDQKKYRIITDFRSPGYGKRSVVDTFEDLLYRHLQHPEAKSLGPDGEPCRPSTRGQLKRAHIIAREHRRIGKESDRRWEQGDDLESTLSRPIVYTPTRERNLPDAMAKASETLIRKIRKIGIRELVRFGCGERILEKICRRQLVRVSTLHEYEQMIEEYKKN